MESPGPCGVGEWTHSFVYIDEIQTVILSELFGYKCYFFSIYSHKLGLSGGKKEKKTCFSWKINLKSTKYKINK